MATTETGQDSADEPGEGASARPPSDHSLIGQIRNGHHDAFALLYRRYVERLRDVVRSQTSRCLAARVDVDDILQDISLAVFAEVVSERCDVPEGESLWGFMVVIALNRIRAVGNWHRAARRDVRRTVGGALSERLVRAIPAPEEWPLVELCLHTAEILQRFSPSEQSWVDLRIEGNNLATIATQARVSTRTVERTLQRFRRALQAPCLRGRDARRKCIVGSVAKPRVI
jgi:RNA polymerase sigma factor (sigma-70 family)